MTNTDETWNLVNLEAERLKRVLIPLEGRWPTDRKQRERVEYELSRFARKVRKLSQSVDRSTLPRAA